MNYVIDFGWKKIIVPVNAGTSAALELLFKEPNFYDTGWTNHDGQGFWKAPESTAITVMTNEELKRRLDAGIIKLQEREELALTKAA